MDRILTALMAAALALSITSCSGDDVAESDETPAAAESSEAAEAPEPGEAPGDADESGAGEESEAAEAPDSVDTADPDLSGLEPLQIIAYDEARESALAACLGTGEASQESCILVWNCAVNEVGVQAVTDPAQEGKLEEALDSCTAAIQ